VLLEGSTLAEVVGERHAGVVDQESRDSTLSAAA